MLLMLLTYPINGWTRIGLEVDPGQMLIDKVVPGEKCYASDMTGIGVIIKNTGTASGKYSLKIVPPSQAELVCFQGYTDIPDARWFWFEDKKGGNRIGEVEIAGEESRKVELCFQIPREKKYYNRHWEAALVIQGESGGAFNLSVVPKYQIETMSSSKFFPGKAPEGNYLEPTVFEFKDVKPAQEYKGTLYFHNNTGEKQMYKLTALSPPEQVAGMFIPRSSKYERIPTATWIVPICRGEKQYPRTKQGKPITSLKKIELESGESRKIELTVVVPDKDWQPKKKWEAFIFVISESNEICFTRIKLDMSGPNNE
jgi:hypothetical protein